MGIGVASGCGRNDSIQAHAVAAKIATMKPGSIRRIKRQLNADDGLAARLEVERQQFVAQIQTDEARDGIVAFWNAHDEHQPFAQLACPLSAETSPSFLGISASRLRSLTGASTGLPTHYRPKASARRQNRHHSAQQPEQLEHIMPSPRPAR